MNRRHFISLLAKTAAISTVAYSFPSIIRPLNIAQPDPADLAYGQRLIYITNTIAFFDSCDHPVYQHTPRAVRVEETSSGLWTATSELPGWLNSEDVMLPSFQITRRDGTT